MSLDLDERQRAMLQEMHVRVWWPRGVDAVEEAAGPAVAPAAAAAATPAPLPAATPPMAAVPMARATLAQDAPVRPIGEVGAMDWPALAAAIADCTACKLCVGRKAPVFEVGPSPGQADWLVVGEPPDEQEERAGRPFAGQAGQLLDNMLRSVQLTRNGSGGAGARLTNVVKCRPAVVRNPQADELATCAAYLQREITLAQPKVILALGRFAALSLLGAGSPELAGLPFGKLRGQVHRYQGIPVVVTYHPSRLLRAQEDKAGAWADLCLAQSVARSGTVQGGA